MLPGGANWSLTDQLSTALLIFSSVCSHVLFPTPTSPSDLSNPWSSFTFSVLTNCLAVPTCILKPSPCDLGQKPMTNQWWLPRMRQHLHPSSNMAVASTTSNALSQVFMSTSFIISLFLWPGFHFSLYFQESSWGMAGGGGGEAQQTVAVSSGCGRRGWGSRLCQPSPAWPEAFP